MKKTPKHNLKIYINNKIMNKRIMKMSMKKTLKTMMKRNKNKIKMKIINHQKTFKKLVIIIIKKKMI